ncbi:MAG: hypothetical protein ACTTKL_01185 [Treponema sp.]
MNISKSLARNLKYLCLTLVLFLLTPLYAERFAAGIKFLSFSSHPKGSPNAPLMPLKFDSRGLFVYNPGGTLNFEYFVVNDIFSFKFVQGLYGDCALHFLGYTHLGFRLRFLKIKRFSTNIGIGPTLIYRQSWFKLDGYDTSEKFMYGTPFEDWEYLFIWYGGEIEFNVRIKDGWDASFSIIPAGIDLINMSVGFRYRFDTKRK